MQPTLSELAGCGYLQTGVSTVVMVDGIWLLSIAYWYVALMMVFTSLWRWALREEASWRVGLIATMTIEARIAMIPMTSKSSMRVKPCRFHRRRERDVIEKWGEEGNAHAQSTRIE